MKQPEIIAFTAVFILLLSASVPIAGGLRAAGTVLIAEIQPGDRVKHTTTVSINEDDPLTNITAEVFGLGQSLDGTTQLLGSEEDTSPYSLREHFSATPSTFHLEPGQSQSVALSGRMPVGVGSGTRYAVMHIETEPHGNGTVGIALAINVPIALTILRTKLVQTGNITNMDLVNATEGLVGQVIFKNTGNHHYRAQAWSTLSNEAGFVVANFTTQVTNSSIIPPYSFQFLSPLAAEELSPGTYLLNVTVRRDDGAFLDEDSKAFSIGLDGNVTGFKPLEIASETAADIALSDNETANATRNETVAEVGEVMTTGASGQMLGKSEEA